MLSCNTYHLTWVSLTLDVGYLFTAAPAKRNHCSLPWTRGDGAVLLGARVSPSTRLSWWRSCSEVTPETHHIPPPFLLQ